MPTTFEALALFLFFLPGIIGAIVYQNAAELKRQNNFDKFAIVFALSLLAGAIGDGVFGIPILGTSPVAQGVAKGATQGTAKGATQGTAKGATQGTAKETVQGTSKRKLTVDDLPKLIDTHVGKDALFRSIIAVVLAGIFALINNKGWLFDVLRFLKITNRTGRIDPWHELFTTHNQTWIRIRYSDGSRLVGYPELFSMTGDKKELLVGNATWHIPDSSGTDTVIDIEGPGVFVSNFDDVRGVDIID